MIRGRRAVYPATLLFLATAAFVTRGNETPDPVKAAERALAHGRHWHASRILRRLPRPARNTPRATLLAARADAGQLAWNEVVRGLGPRAWLDSAALGEGRALLARAWLETGHYERAVQNYRTYLAYAVERHPRGLAEIGLARAFAGLGSAVEAAAAYGRATELLPTLEPWLALRAAEQMATNGDTAAVRRWLARATGVPAARRARATADAFARATDPDRAVQALLAATGDADPAGSAELRVRAARIRLRHGDTAIARGILRRAVRETPGDALDAADLLSLLPGLSPSDHLALGRAYERSEAPGRAVPEYRSYLAGSHLSSAARRAWEMKIGELLLSSGDNAGAAAEMKRLLAARPSRHLRARAELVLARARYRSGHRSEGRSDLRKVGRQFAGTGTGLTALSLLSDLYEYAGDADSARALYEETAKTYPWSRSAARARFRLGIMSFLDGDYVAARRHFDAGRHHYRGGALNRQITYWAARARLAEGGSARAREADRLLRNVQGADPFGYYGLLAAERLGIDPWAGLPAGPEPAQIPPETRRAFATIELLRRAGLTDEAGDVLGAVVDAPPDNPRDLLGLAAALASHGFGGESVRLGWLAHERLHGRWSTHLLQAIYPFPYPNIILAESRERGLDPYLLAAVARQESQFDPEATSAAGARGLLQLMPRTAREWARAVGVRDYRDELLFHPEINVHLGAAFLSYLKHRYRELQIMLVAYNAGPTRARRWRTRPAYDADPELFVERIPFSETRTYIKAIQRHLRIYRHLYSGYTEDGGKAPAASG